MRIRNTHRQSTHTRILICIVVLISMLFTIAALSCKPKEDSTDGRSTETTKEDRESAGSRGRGRGGDPSRSTYVYSVVATTAVPSLIVDTITVGGDIQAKNTANLQPDVSGTLHSIPVVEGEWVRRGSVVAYVNPSKAGQKYNLSPVLASISGTVVSLPITVGNTVGPQSTIATISDDSEIEMKTNIPEKYVGKVAKGTKGILSVIAYPNEIFDMELVSLSRSLSTITHSMPVTFSFEKRDKRLKSGMYGNLEVILEKKEDVFVVQRDVILIRLVNNVSAIGVFVVNTEVEPNELGEHLVRFAPVELGIEDKANRIEVVKGLQEGDVVIVQGQDALSEGSMVRIFVLDGKELISMEEEIERLKNDSKIEADTIMRRPGQR